MCKAAHERVYQTWRSQSISKALGRASINFPFDGINSQLCHAGLQKRLYWWQWQRERQKAEDSFLAWSNFLFLFLSALLRVISPICRREEMIFSLFAFDCRHNSELSHDLCEQARWGGEFAEKHRTQLPQRMVRRRFSRRHPVWSALRLRRLQCAGKMSQKNDAFFSHLAKWVCPLLTLSLCFHQRPGFFNFNLHRAQAFNFVCP